MESVKDAKKVMETQEYVDAVPEVPPDHKDQAMNVQIGMEGLGAMAKDPKLMAEAMESLKDPEIAREVQKMMAGTAGSIFLSHPPIYLVYLYKNLNILFFTFLSFYAVSSSPSSLFD